jgi:putative DNA-invertase from lambdoid prophage Rac
MPNRVTVLRWVAHDVEGFAALYDRAREMQAHSDRLERDDLLVMTKLDRLGRNSIDVQTTVKRLDEMGVRVHSLALVVSI